MARILLLASSYNGLTQRAHTELDARGHEINIALAISDEAMQEAVDSHRPDLIVCPFLKHRVPATIWRSHLCIIIHPGIKGDRGPSSLDWAIMNGEPEWGVTALEASEEMDAGAIWATATFPMRAASKSSLYRNEVTNAGVRVILETVAKFERDGFRPEPLNYDNADVKGRLRPLMQQPQRRLDWQGDSTAALLQKLNAGDSNPGVLDTLFGEQYFLYGAHAEGELSGPPGEIIARRYGAICRATVDGAIWISHLKKKKTDEQRHFKLPAETVLGDALRDVPELLPKHPLAFDGSEQTFKEIWYQEREDVGYLHFEFYNGAQSTEQCERLTEAFRAARERPTKVIVLLGGKDFWSNGIHLNTIEAAPDPGEESWANINAIDDFVCELVNTTSKLVISAVEGNAGAGGVILALAADTVLLNEHSVLNPHYKSMGLFGSEYWTYLLPKRVGHGVAQQLTQRCLPIGAAQAKAIGLVDEIVCDGDAPFVSQVRVRAEQFARHPLYHQLLAEKAAERARDEAEKPLLAYRTEELAQMNQCFFGADSEAYHAARRNFVYKRCLDALPAHLVDFNRRPDGSVAPARMLPAAIRRIGAFWIGTDRPRSVGERQAG